MEDFDTTDPLWETLGRARKVQVSPFFARDVARAIRLEQDKPKGLEISSLLRWLIPVSAAAAVGVLWAGLLHSPAPSTVAEESFYDIADLPALVSVDETHLWVDDSNF